MPSDVDCSGERGNESRVHGGTSKQDWFNHISIPNLAISEKFDFEKRKFVLTAEMTFADASDTFGKLQSLTHRGKGKAAIQFAVDGFVDSPQQSNK